MSGTFDGGYAQYPLRPSGGMADTEDSKSSARKGVWVRVPPRLLDFLARHLRSLGVALMSDRECIDVVVPAVVLAELYRGQGHDQTVDAYLSRDAEVLVQDTDRSFARLVGSVLTAARTGSKDIVDARRGVSREGWRWGGAHRRPKGSQTTGRTVPPRAHQRDLNRLACLPSTHCHQGLVPTSSYWDVERLESPGCVPASFGVVASSRRPVDSSGRGSAREGRQAGEVGSGTSCRSSAPG